MVQLVALVNLEWLKLWNLTRRLGRYCLSPNYWLVTWLRGYSGLAPMIYLFEERVRANFFIDPVFDGGTEQRFDFLLEGIINLQLRELVNAVSVQQSQYLQRTEG